jgi:cytoskeleton protein RodZ
VTDQTDGVGGSDGIGVRLRDARERAGLSLIEAAEKLHVEPRAIEALEAENFEEFGASVYVRGHIRHYAELVGESPVELQQLYAESAHAVAAPDLTRVPHVRSADASPVALAPGIAIVLSVALVGSGWWIAGNFHGASSEPVEAAAAPATAPGGPGGTAGIPAGGLLARAVPTQGSSVLRAVLPRSSSLARAVATETGASGARGGPADRSPLRRALAKPSGGTDAPGAGLGRELAAQSSGGAARVALVPEHPSPAAATGFAEQRSAMGHAKASALELHFNEDSWAEVYDAHGERLLFDVGSADSTRTVSGTPPLRVVLGNPTGVALELNGRPVSVPEGAARNVSIEFRINRSGRVAPSHLAAAEARNEEKKPGRD